MKCGAECLEDVVSTVKRKKLKIGNIVVVQTHGRSGRYNPHLHIIMTSGGISDQRHLDSAITRKVISYGK